MCQMEMQRREENKTFSILPKRRETYTGLEPNRFHLDNSTCENLEFCEENMFVLKLIEFLNI